MELDSAGKHGKTKFFTWEERLRIAVDAASGQKVNIKLSFLNSSLPLSIYVFSLRIGVSAKWL